MTTTSWRFGIDEAGYGPTLGPLCVGLVRLEGGSEALVPPVRTSAAQFPVIDDSKRVLKGRFGLARLETTALAALAVAHGSWPRSSRALLRVDEIGERPAPWYALEVTLPLAATPAAIDQAARALKTVLAERKAVLSECAVRVLTAAEFNRQVATLLNKALIERLMIEELLALHLPSTADASVSVDRLGGRRRYGEWLSTLYPFASLSVIDEEKAASRYVLRQQNGRTRSFEFLVGGDQQVKEIALASCLAKYFREVSMHLFNRFWCARSDGLKPTAGYAVDARRFLEQIAHDPLSSELEPLMVRRL